MLRLLTWSPEGADEARRERGVERHRGQKTTSDTDERNTQHGIQPLSESRVYETRRAILQPLAPTLTLDFNRVSGCTAAAPGGQGHRVE